MDKNTAIEVTKTSLKWAGIVLAWMGLAVAWAFQYGFAVWMVYVWRVFRFAGEISGGIVLVCIPVIGWIILIVLLVKHNPERLPAKSVWTPWGLKATAQLAHVR